VTRASDAQHAFNAGEFSSLLLGRQDVKKYASALFVCLNAIPLTQGAWTRRPGTAFLQQCRHHDKAARVIPFQYSITQTYVLEFGEAYIRFFTNHGVLTKTAQNITAISKANPAVLTYSGTDSYANGERVYVTGVVGMTQVNNREFKVANVNAGANTFELQDSGSSNVNSLAYDTYSSGGSVAEILEVTTAFAETDLAQIRVTQSADTLFIMHPDFPPQKLVRVSATSWTLSDVAFTDGPYDSLNTTATTLTPSAATGSGVTLTASAVTGINNDTGFQATDVGRLIRIREGSTWGYVLVTGYTNTTVVTVTVLSTLTNTNAKVNWRMGIWSDTTGYPACGTFYEDRLFLAGAALYPQRLDGSKTGVYTSFSPSATDGTIADDNAVAYVLNSDDVNAIRWMAANEKGLLVGTSRAEWQVRASTATAALTPTDISARPSSRYGSAEVAPVNAGKTVLFVQRAARKLRELAYLFEIEGFRAPDMTLLSEHITRPSIDELAYQEQPQAIVWGVRGDGVLLGFTYERDQDVIGWHRHELGGQSDDDGLLIPVVESVAVVPAPDATRDELYVVVQRYVNGGVKRYIEYMSKLWEVEDEQEDAFYVDCGWTAINSPAAATVTGLWHLEGETVGIYADGARRPDVVVTNGTVTLATTASIITLGYLYNSDGQDMPVEGGAQDGSAQSKIKKISRVGFWLVDTLGLKHGMSADELTEIIVREWGDDFGVATPLFTGVVRDRFDGDYDKLGQVYWRADGPFPATVLSVMKQYVTSDDS
jgi:hypothetical protein